MKKLIKNKKAIEVWISWVLLMGFVVMISVLMYDFIRDYTKETAEEIKRVASNTAECNLVAVSIDEVCKDTSSTPIYLNITVTNRLNINIDQLMFRTFDTSNKFLNISTLDVSTETLTLRPQQSKKVTLNVSDSEVNTLQLIPVVFKDDITIICRNKIVEHTPIMECS